MKKLSDFWVFMHHLALGLEGQPEFGLQVMVRSRRHGGLQQVPRSIFFILILK